MKMLNVAKIMMMIAVAINVAGIMGLVYPDAIADGSLDAGATADVAVADGGKSTPLPATGEDATEEALVFALPEYVLLCGTAAAIVSLPWATAHRRTRRFPG